MHSPIFPFQHDLAAEFIAKYQLNTDQAAALQRAADMMNKDAEPIASVLLIHGQLTCRKGIYGWFCLWLGRFTKWLCI